MRGHFSADFGGMPMKGLGITTYHRGLGEWQNTWVDNMGANLAYAEMGKAVYTRVGSSAESGGSPDQGGW